MMGMKTCAATLAGVAASLVLATPALAQQGNACDQNCLSGVMTRYLSALAAHDPGAAGFAADVRTTENDMPVKPGDGLWGTFDRFGGYRHVFSDPVSGEVAAYATIVEHGQSELMMVRLKVAAEQITQAETLVVRPQTFLNTKLSGVKPIFNEIVAPDKRLSRETLMTIANSYFEAILHSDGDLAPFAANCNRTENGVQTTNAVVHLPGQKGPPPRPLGCHDQMNTGAFAYITEIKPRRFVIADPKHGLAFGVFMFRHNGQKLTGKSKSGKVVKMIPEATRPFNVEVSELFKIKDGKIREIEAVMVTLPYRTPDPWAQGGDK